MDNRPRGREKNVTGAGKDIYKRGSGLGTGPVGQSGGYQNRRPSASSGTPASSGRPVSSSGTPTRAAGKSKSLIGIILAAIVALGGGGAGLSSLLGGGSGSAAETLTTTSPAVVTETEKPSYSGWGSSSSWGSGSSWGGSSSGSSSSYGSSYYPSFSGSSTSSGWDMTSNCGQLDTSVAAGARQKRTTILGKNNDTVTIMIYMCGTDLESQSGMATSDLQEMISAGIADNVNVLVYTGGCKKWKNTVISSSVNEIYKVESGGLRRLVDNGGKADMTKPATLTSFIQWCVKNYPANRNELIFWDHGGGSLSGFGYDEKHASSGSMTLSGINKALADAGTVFDFIGFDACLMGTTETALMLSDYADYMIASEEAEPGIGWYYTNWLNLLSKNASSDTLTIGKQIVDDFVDVCARRCPGQPATLSVVDLGELEATIPQHLKTFSTSTLDLMANDQYQTVSDARAGSREFASSSRIDQVDFVHLASKLDTSESKALAKALLSAVKYNRTSSSMTNAYGLSIYFPYKKVSKVDQAVSTYNDIGIDSEYSRCIQKFASMETGGQAISGGASSPLSSLLSGYGASYGASSGSSYGSSSGSSYGSSFGVSPYGSSYGSMDTDAISEILSGLLGGSFGSVSGLTGQNSSFLGRSLDVDSTAAYLASHQFDASQLFWTADAEGRPVMKLAEDQWSLIHDLELNVFFDDGNGFLDLGLDNVFDFTEDGALVGAYDGTWLAINDQPVAYYHLDTYDDGENYCITGRVPVLLNGVRSDLILVFDNDHPYGYVAGARFDYRNGETETIAKSMTELQEGDRLDFLCDYYGYDGSYQDSYCMGDPMTVSGELTISNVYIDADAAQPMYRFTDIYQQEYWSPVLIK